MGLNADGFGRKIDYLRVSITDRCNLRCFYCMPEEGIDKMSSEHILDYEDIIKIIKVGSELGIRKVRLTGGEPLIRRNFIQPVSEISDINGIEDISLTTNGVYLGNWAKELKQAGLSRVNISLDTLDPNKYFKITRGGKLSDVFNGINKAKEEGLLPIKINVVVIKGVNDDDILNFARLTQAHDYEVRFIEYMPIGNVTEWDDRHLPVSDIKNRCRSIDELIPADTKRGNGPAKYFKFKSAQGKLGFISPISEHFCSECNRIRLTSDGKLRTCLYSGEEIDLRNNLEDERHLYNKYLEAFMNKPDCSGFSQEVKSSEYQRKMNQIGG